jgi:hypothetical protein
MKQLLPQYIFVGICCTESEENRAFRAKFHLRLEVKYGFHFIEIYETQVARRLHV